MTDSAQNRRTISLERRVEGLAFVLTCVRRSYPDQPIDLANLLDLVQKVADAREILFGEAVLVHGTRLLDMRELDELLGILERP
jgi:hypothetical protein